MGRKTVRRIVGMPTWLGSERKREESGVTSGFPGQHWGRAVRSGDPGPWGARRQVLVCEEVPCSRWPRLPHEREGAMRGDISAEKHCFGFVLIRKAYCRGQARRTSGLGSETLNSPQSAVDVNQNSVWSAAEDKSAPMFVWGYPCGFFNEEKDEPSLDLIGCLGSGWDLLHILWQQVSFLIAKDSHPGNAKALRASILDSEVLSWDPGSAEQWWDLPPLTSQGFHRWKPIPPFHSCSLPQDSWHQTCFQGHEFLI